MTFPNEPANSESWKTEIGQAEPFPAVVPGAEESLLARNASGSSLKRLSLVLLAAIVLAGPAAIRIGQEINENRMRAEQAAALERQDVLHLANRVSGQFAQAVSIFTKTAQDIESFEGGRTEAAALMNKARNDAQAALAFFSSAASQADDLVSAENAMTSDFHDEIFGDSATNISSFYSGFGARIEGILNSGNNSPNSEMTTSLAALQASDIALRDWLVRFQRVERR